MDDVAAACVAATVAAASGLGGEVAVCGLTDDSAAGRDARAGVCDAITGVGDTRPSEGTLGCVTASTDDVTPAAGGRGCDIALAIGGRTCDVATAAGGRTCGVTTAAGGRICDVTPAVGDLICDATTADGIVSDATPAADGFASEETPAADGFVSDAIPAADDVASDATPAADGFSIDATPATDAGAEGASREIEAAGEAAGCGLGKALDDALPSAENPLKFSCALEGKTTSARGAVVRGFGVATGALTVCSSSSTDPESLSLLSVDDVTEDGNDELDELLESFSDVSGNSSTDATTPAYFCKTTLRSFCPTTSAPCCTGV